MPEAIAPPPAAAPEAEAGALVPVEPAKPAWRTVVKHERRERKPRNHAAAAASPPPAPAPVPVMAPQMPAWAQWKRAYAERLDLIYADGMPSEPASRTAAANGWFTCSNAQGR